MDDIAKAAVAKGTLDLYFDSKAAVFRAMQAANFEQTEGRCQAAEAQEGPSAKSSMASSRPIMAGCMRPMASLNF